MTSSVTVDEFQALEQKVLRAVEIIKSEREARATAEAEVVRLRQQLVEQQQSAQSQIAEAQGRAEAAQTQLATLQNQIVAAQSNAETIQSQAEAAQREKANADDQIAALNQEREAVRQRVERMLNQMDELL
jgi:chromosome segregation ATPase